MLFDRHGALAVALAALVAPACGHGDPCATRSSPRTCRVTRIVGDLPNGELGFRFGEPVDVDGDGAPDLVAGMRFTGAGAAGAWSGSGALIHRWSGEQPDSLFGQIALGVPGVGVVVAAPLAKAPDAARGQLDAYAATGTRRWRVVGEKYEGLGWHVAIAGDVDRDGVTDLWAGAPSNPALGRAYLLSGVDGHVLRHVDSSRREDAFGWYVAALGDLDGDGVPDVAIGAPNAVVDGAPRGTVTLASAATGAVLRELAGERPGQHFGEVMTGLDDLDGDGIADLAVGAPGNPAGAGGPGRGEVRILSGKTGATLHRLEAAADGELYGRMVATLDDLDGDGLRDLAIGAPWAMVEGAARAGRVEIRSARSLALLAEIRGAEADAWFGWHVTRAARGLLVSAPRAVHGLGALELHVLE